MAQAEAFEATSVASHREAQREGQLLAVLDGLQTHLDNSATIERSALGSFQIK